MALHINMHSILTELQVAIVSKNDGAPVKSDRGPYHRFNSETSRRSNTPLSGLVHLYNLLAVRLPNKGSVYAPKSENPAHQRRRRSRRAV